MSRQCEGKAGYSSARLAKLALKACRPAGFDARIYRCPDCGELHLTNRTERPEETPKRDRRSRRRQRRTDRRKAKQRGWS